MQHCHRMASTNLLAHTICSCTISFFVHRGTNERTLRCNPFHLYFLLGSEFNSAVPNTFDVSTDTITHYFFESFGLIYIYFPWHVAYARAHSVQQHTLGLEFTPQQQYNKKVKPTQAKKRLGIKLPKNITKFSKLN